MGKASRDKGRRAQSEGSQLLVDAGWRCVDTSAGDAVEDVFAIDPLGDQWAVEITVDQGVSMVAKWGQAVRQATARDVEPLMLWKVDRAGWWLIAHHGAVARRRARLLECELRPPARMAFTTMARQLDELRPQLGAESVGAMPVIRTAAHYIAPAEAALVRWWT